MVQFLRRRRDCAARDRVLGARIRPTASRARAVPRANPALPAANRTASIIRGFHFFGRKFVESYFNLKLAFSDPGLLGPPVWERAQVAFRLAIIYRIDLTLVFLDTFLSHLWWNTGDGGWYRAELYAGAEYFDAMGGYTSPCRRGYAKLLATTNMESKYKPKI